MLQDGADETRKYRGGFFFGGCGVGPIVNPP
jgi:hypothetical protein